MGTRTLRPLSSPLGATLKIYGNQGTRSPLVNWYLEELGVEFENINAATVDRSSPAYPNPFGSMPAAEDNNVKLFESGAILLFIADKYGGLDTPEKRAAVTKWVMWANASLDPICFVENDRGQVLDTKLKGSPKAIATLNDLLGDRGPWLLGDEFSVADVAVGSYILYTLLFFPQVRLAKKWPNLAGYAAACAQRPAYIAAFGADTATKLADIALRKN